MKTPTRESPLFKHNIPISSLSLYVSSIPTELKKHASDNQLIFEELKPFWLLSKLFGIFPLHKSPTGEFRFKILSAAMLYSLIFYIALSTLSAYAITLLAVSILEKGKLDFTESVSYYCNLLYTLSHYPTVPLNWMKGAKLADFINNWQKFQNLFEKVTGNPLRLRLRRRAWICAIFIPLSGSVLVFTLVVLKSGLGLTWMTLLLGVQGSYALSLVMVQGGMWMLLCLSLQRSGVQLRCSFKQEVSRADCSPSNIAKYRGLWLSLSHLTRELGDIYCYSLGLVCLIWFTIFLCSIYVILISSIKTHLSDLEVSFISSAIMCFSFLVVICNYAYNHTIQLGSGFQELVVSSMSGSNQRVKKELTIFLEVMIANPPVISFGGYIVIDRQLLVNYMSTTATYLVVLLQFGIHD